jgi:preprotein translocase subunit SecB
MVTPKLNILLKLKVIKLSKEYQVILRLNIKFELKNKKAKRFIVKRLGIAFTFEKVNDIKSFRVINIYLEIKCDEVIFGKLRTINELNI